MTPEAREMLKAIVRELLERVEIPETYSEFISQSVAEKTGDTWVVFVNGAKLEGAIPNVQGNAEFEAKENAWTWFKSIVDECKSTES
jgi:hypothetical protein